jgi:pilus assembly protein CpaC
VAYPTSQVAQGGVQGNGPAAEVGFHIKLTPSILEGQDVDVNVDIEQSNQVGKGNNGTPIIARHKVKSRLYLKSGETAALTAVNKQDVSTSFNRDDVSPGAFVQSQGTAQTKPLFSFQRSKNMSKSRGQFVIFINPQIIDNASEGTEDLKKNFRMTSSTR